VFNLGWVATIEICAISIFLKGLSLPTGTLHWILIVCLAVFSFLGQYTLAAALKLEHCSPIAVIRATSDILLSFLWQYLLFKDDKLDIWSISGGIIVTFSIILTTLRKYLISLPKNSSIKKKLNFLAQ
jgi:drug/metabolite transporter (DMT)-like permease